MDRAMAPFLGKWRVALRAVQAVTSVVLMGSAGHLASIYTGFWAPSLGVFVSVMALLTSALYLAAPRIDRPALHGSLPGLLDIILSGLWAIFALTAGSGLAAVDMCAVGYYIFGYFFESPAPAGLCAAAGLAIASSFVLFAALSASCVLAGLDLRGGLGLVAPASALRRAKAPDHWSGIMAAPAAKTSGVPPSTAHVNTDV